MKNLSLYLESLALLVVFVPSMIIAVPLKIIGSATTYVSEKIAHLMDDWTQRLSGKFTKKH